MAEISTLTSGGVKYDICDKKARAEIEVLKSKNVEVSFDSICIPIKLNPNYEDTNSATFYINNLPSPYNKNDFFIEVDGTLKSLEDVKNDFFDIVGKHLFVKSSDRGYIPVALKLDMTDEFKAFYEGSDEYIEYGISDAGCGDYQITPSSDVDYFLLNCLTIGVYENSDWNSNTLNNATFHYGSYSDCENLNGKRLYLYNKPTKYVLKKI